MGFSCEIQDQAACSQVKRLPSAVIWVVILEVIWVVILEVIWVVILEVIWVVIRVVIWVFFWPAAKGRHSAQTGDPWLWAR